MIFENMLYGVIESIDPIDSMFSMFKRDNDHPLSTLLLNIWIDKHLLQKYDVQNIVKYKTFYNRISQIKLFKDINQIVLDSLSNELSYNMNLLLDIQQLANHLTGAIFIIVYLDIIDRFDEYNWCDKHISNYVNEIKTTINKKWGVE